MKKTLTVPALTLGALLIGSLAFAWQGDGPGNRQCDGNGKGRGMNIEQHQDRMDRHHEFMVVALDLSADQQAKLDALREKHQQARQAMREAMRASREELRNLAQAQDFDEATYRAKARASADLKTDMFVNRNQHKQEMLALLTPEQQAKAEKLWSLHKQERRGGCGAGDNDRGRRHHDGQGFRRGPAMTDQE